jgi:hypothetical protein
MFPLVGMLLCVAFMMLLMRLVCGGHGVMSMGGHRGLEGDEAADLRREIRGLQQEIDRLKAQR